jgi:glycoside/pentoside/hexuronide:cation symporter, GPH family
MTTTAAPHIAATPLPFRRKLSLASADYGFTIVYHTIELFLLFYYTDVLGLDPLFAGMVLTVGLLWDAFFDPLAGSLADRTRTRWGRFRPWVFVSAPFLAIGVILTFAGPMFPQLEMAAYALISHLLLRSAYTAGTVPFNAMSARVTRNTADRTTIAGLRMQFSGLASLTVALGLPFALDFAGDGREATGFFYGSFALALLVLVSLTASMATVREPAEGDSVTAKEPVSILQILRDDVRAFGMLVTRNGSFARVLIAIVLVSTAGTMISKTTIYFYKYYVEAPDLGRYALATSAMSLLIIAPLWALLANRTSKRTAWMWATLIATTGLTGLMLVPQQMPYLTLALLFVTGAGTTGHSVLFWAMIPDTVEVNEVTFGDRHEAKTLGFALFARKLTLAINAFWIGATLTAVGYTPNAAQGPDALAALKSFIAVIPLLCVVASALVIRGYRLDAETHRALVEQAERQRQAGVVN